MQSSSTNTTIISVNDICTCTQLLSQYDCEIAGCTWNKTCLKTENDNSNSTEPISNWCNQVENIESNCSQTSGCAYFNKNCQQFTGCTSYVFTTHDECYAINTKCTSDGVQCITPRACKLNQNEQLCSSVISSSGSKKCVWNVNVCRDQICSEASTTYTSNSQCNQFISGCITNGRGCVTQLELCYTYGKDCNGKIGTDGACIYYNEKCQPKDCNQADSTYNTDAKCQAYRSGCKTYGYGCLQNALKSCTTYTGNSDKCLGFIGKEGKCELGQNGNCQARKCESASALYTNDAQCSQYLSGCLSNGAGCVVSLKLCNSYIGTMDECSKKIGSDGKCIGTQYDTTASCRVRQCQDRKYTTKDECSSYQNGCITNGVTCVSILLPCISYSSDCDQIIGSDGNCTTGSDSKCKIKECSSGKFTTTSECQAIQTYCISNGYVCLDKQTCPNTNTQFACGETNSCQWTSQCVSNQCSSFPTQAICTNNVANVICFWTGYDCVDKKCYHAPSSYVLNSQCSAFLTGCVTNGQGCISASASCEEYTGMYQLCTTFKGSNGTISCVLNTDNQLQQCRSIQCSDNYISTSQEQCSEFMEQCLFQGIKGCRSVSDDCTTFYGNQTTCYQLNQLCYQDANISSSCRSIKCQDNNDATSDYQCELFMKGCLTTGKGCISSTEPCSSYVGYNVEDCQDKVGNGKPCWYDPSYNGTCVDKSCELNTTYTSSDLCESFLPGCVSNGQGCQLSNLGCTTYNGNENQCGTFYGNNLKCVKLNQCQDRLCDDIDDPQKETDCSEYLDTCTYNGSKCIVKSNCQNYYGYNDEICQQIIDINGNKCWNQQNLYCTNRICTDATSIQSQQDCNNFRSNCLYNGVDGCVEIQNECNLYTNFTQGACNLAKTISNDLCWYSNGQCNQRSCDDQLDSYSDTICTNHYNNCIFTGLKCTQKKDYCNQYTLSQTECQNINCWKEINDTITQCSPKTCSDTLNSVSDSICRNHLDTCRFNGITCIDAEDTCDSYTGFTTLACKSVTTSSGDQCWYTSTTTCTERTCDDSLSTYNSTSCQNHLNSCRFNGIKCVSEQQECLLYTGFTKEACQQVTNSDEKSCWYPGNGTTCADASCTDLIVNPSEINCKAHLSTCRFNGTRCVSAQQSCEQYQNYTSELCQNTTDSNGQLCWSNLNNTSKCVTKACSNKLSQYSLSICQSFYGCSYDGTKCLTEVDTCDKYDGLTLEQCQTVTINSKQICWKDNNQSKCRERLCSDNTDAKSDFECNQFLSGCKTNGNGCINSSLPCTSYVGTLSSCMAFIGNSIKCRGLDENGQCQVRQCYHNGDANSDNECEQFKIGCVTNGNGCISSTENCTKYIGNQTTCSTFVGNNIKCWNDSITVINQCRDRECSDNTTATSDSECQSFLPGCVTNLYGCISATLPCSSYQGNQSQCRKFKGQNGTTYCWNTNESLITDSCTDRTCSNILRATNTVECQQFLPGCVSDGTQCIQPTYCSGFYGTSHSCPLFQAIDKPCKGNNNTIQQCSQLVCSDAPNNYTTDKQCNKFKLGCITNGFGCTDSNDCNVIKTKQICQIRSNCQFISGCRNSYSSCLQINNYSQCLNNTNIKCYWNYNAKICRDWVCSDASVLLTSHYDCQQLNSNCTTSGNGCITISDCSTYTTKSICINALSNGYTSKCVWNKTFCRSFVCEDAPTSFTTDSECLTINSRCVTSGQGCTYYYHSCNSIKTKANCVADSYKKPCLWINNSQCVNFTQCTDIEGQTHSECQQYSSLCTSDGITCIPLMQCSQYPNPIGCIEGTDGKCGWVIGNGTNTQQCQLFNGCSSIYGSTQEECEYYSQDCTSDGLNCVTKDVCSSYQTEIACNYNGTDGYCQWDSNILQCRLRVCTDAPIIDDMSYEYCSSFEASTECTTNSSQCINISYCKNYLEQSCYYGLDGECIFALPLGQVSGTKLCRIMDCTDYLESTTLKCQQHLSSCVSNGVKCISKSQCSSYLTQTACESDGTDGICIYQSGTCSLLTSCVQANSNEVACTKKSKVCKYVVDQDDEGNISTSCNEITCSSDNSSCNPIYNWDETTFEICLQQTETNCIQGEPTYLSQQRCYSKSLFTYTWNSNNNTCDKCQATNVNNTNNDTNTDSYSQILMLLFLIIQ